VQLTTQPLTGDGEAFDPQDPGPFARLAGSQLVRFNGGTAIIRTRGGDGIPSVEMPVYPGWLVIRPAGSGDGEALFLAPENVGEGQTWGITG
jgi:hypothetical protein